MAQNTSHPSTKEIDKRIGENEVRWANNLGNPGISPIVLEVKMNNKETANRIKRTFREMKRDDTNIPDNLYISNNYTRATRVGNNESDN